MMIISFRKTQDSMLSSVAILNIIVGNCIPMLETYAFLLSYQIWNNVIIFMKKQTRSSKFCNTFCISMVV